MYRHRLRPPPRPLAARGATGVTGVTQTLVAKVLGSGTLAARGRTTLTQTGWQIQSTAADPPTITVQPQAQSVTAPGSATFTVTATGTAPLSYQWQRNGVNINGATSSSYTLSPTTTGDTGAQFRCVVTNPYGSATSNAALLTVASGTTDLPALGALSFYANSGADDYARLLSIPSTFGTGEFTFEFRCKLDESFPVGAAGGTSTTNWSNADPARYSNSSWWYAGNFLLDGHNNTDVRLGTFSVQVIGGGRLRWTFGDNTQLLSNGGLLAVQPVPAASAASLLDDSWHHVALVRRWSGASSATLEMWIDGALVASETSPARTNMQTYWATWGGYGGGIQNGWVLGAEKFSAGGGTYWDDYKGQVGYLRFYNRAKTSTELGNDWARDSTQGESGLVGLFQVGSLAANRTYDTIRPTEYIECFPQAGAARVTDIPIVARLPAISFTRGTQGSVNLATGARTGTVSPAAGSYVAGFNPTQHVIQRDPASTALPAGVSLSSAGVMAYDGTGSTDVTASNVRIQVLASAEADWQARSTAAGVVFTERFDTLQIGPGAGGGRYYNGDYGQRGFLDTTGPRVSGTGSLRLEHRPNENNPNMTGRYSRDTADGGSLLPNWGPGSVFWVQFRYRIDTNWFNNIPTWAGQGHKLILLHQDNISCGQIELSLQHYSGWYSTRVLRMYTGCGSPNLFTNLTNPSSQTTPPFLIQQRWNIDGGAPYSKDAGYELQYSASNADGAFQPQANTWYTFDFRVQLPSSWGASNCRVEAWVTPAGGTQRQKFIAWVGAMFSNGEPVNVMNNLTLTGYLSNGANNAASTGSCWYDEVIVSTQPIALPTALPVSP